MTVYIEYAFGVNFLLDGLLLFLALKCAKVPIKAFRLIAAAAVGAGEAVGFPLLSLPLWCAYAVKFLGGCLLVLIAVKRGSFKTLAAATGCFFAMTFLLGGILMAAYSFFSVPYEGGEGYLLEPVPVALLLCAAVGTAAAVLKAAKAFHRYRAFARNLIPCKITAGGRTVSWRGLADSGNLLRFRGEPVCVVSYAGALLLFRNLSPEGRIQMKTVGSSKEAPVFRAEIELWGERKNCYFTVGDVSSKEYQLIVHSALAEEAHERIDCIKGVAEEVRRMRKRRTLSVRKRGAASPSFDGGRGGNAEKT